MYFFLLVLEVFFDLISNVVYKYDRFSETLLEESLEFVSFEKNNPVLLNYSFVLLAVEIDSILEKQSCKKDVFMVHGIGHVKIILILSAKVITLYMQACIIQVGVLGLKKTITKS